MAFAVRRGDIKERADVKYSAGAAIFAKLYAKPLFPLKSLSEVIVKAQYGTSALTSEVPVGWPVIRMNNLQNDGWDFSDLKYIEPTDADITNYRLNEGDILFNRTNSAELVGKCEVFREKGEWLYASYLIRIVLDQSLALPEFVAAFLNTRAGRVQIDRVSRPIAGMSNINAEELRSLVLPLPLSIEVQNKLTQELYSAKKRRDDLNAEAVGLLKTMDDLLLKKLKIPKLEPKLWKSFAVRAGMLKSSQRSNTAYFHPERLLSIRAIENSAKAGLRAERLDAVADFVREVVPFAENSNYLSLSNVQSDTGELLPTSEEVTGNCAAFKSGDVLMARLRPYLNKVHLAERDGICSPEFHVIRVKHASPDERVDASYLATVLRSSLIVSQTRHMTTGNTHPRLANEDVVGLIVPIPSPSVQKELVDEVKRRREEARRLRLVAQKAWDDARSRFEGRLLGLAGDKR